MKPLYKSDYRAEIDGLRAFAVLSVVVFHAFPSWLSGGFIGVDVFFVISGFLITRHIFEKFNEGQFSFVDFFQRRIRRIFPALLLVMVSSLVFGWFFLLADEYLQLNTHVVSGAAFILNFVLVNESGYFDNEAITKPMLHLWSLAVEEQFYIIWPLVLWFAWKRQFNLLTITIVVAIISFCINLRFISSNPIETFFWPIGRFWEFLSGSVFGWFLLFKRDQLSKAKHWIDSYLGRLIRSKEAPLEGSHIANVMSVLGALLLAFSVVRINDELAFPSTWALLPVLGTLLIISAGSKAWFNHVFLMNPLAVWFGLISYPLYLWHWPVASFLYILEGDWPHGYKRILGILLSILLAWITYKFIEQPIRKRGLWDLKTYALCFLMASTFIFSFVVSKTEGNILPFTPKQSVSITAKASPKRDECHFPLHEDFIERDACVYFGETPSVAVFGDSHSVELAYGLADELQKSGIGIDHHTMSGCSHDRSEQSENHLICADWQQAVVKSIVSDIGIETVVVSFRNERYLQDIERRAVLVQMLTELAQAQKEVVLVLQVPLPKMHVYSDIRKFVDSPQASVKGRSRQEWETLYGAKRLLLLELPPSVKVYDPIDVFCDASDCYSVRNGEALFFDDNHMSIAAARLLSKEITKLFN